MWKQNLFTIFLYGVIIFNAAMVLLKRKRCISCLLYLVSLLTFENGDCNIYLLGKTLFIQDSIVRADANTVSTKNISHCRLFEMAKMSVDYMYLLWLEDGSFNTRCYFISERHKFLGKDVFRRRSPI